MGHAQRHTGQRKCFDPAEDVPSVSLLLSAGPHGCVGGRPCVDFAVRWRGLGLDRTRGPW